MNTSIPGLHDIHLPASPGWWPPAPGWWVLATVVTIAVVWSMRKLRVQRVRKRRLANALLEFDRAIDNAKGGPARLAAASEQLRRAARLRAPAAAQLDCEAWLRFLDGEDPSRSFSQGQGSLLRDGAFRRTLDEDIAQAMMLARARFVTLLEPETVERGHA